MGKLLKGLVKFTVATAAVGGLCYAFKDQIRESKVYQEHDMDEKLAKVKNTLKEKVPAIFDNEKDYVEDDELFSEDMDIEAEDPARDYVEIATEDKKEDEAPAEDAGEDGVPTIDV